MKRYSRLLYGTVLALGGAWIQAAEAGPQHAVVELFTSQGCSSCPPADALVGRLSADPGVLALSFHVSYWDDLGWKDAFSSQASTDRQYAYAHSLGERSVFTPQIVVNGTQSVVGSQEAAVRRQLAAANQTSFPVQADLLKQADGRFKLTLAGPVVRADVWEFRYVRHSVTRIGAGENGGRSLDTFNDVTRIQRLASFAPGTLELEALAGKADGIAVVVQAPGAGKVLGAAAYQPAEPAHRS